MVDYNAVYGTWKKEGHISTFAPLSKRLKRVVELGPAEIDVDTLAPRKPVFVDGKYLLSYSPEAFADYKTVLGEEIGFLELLAERVQAVLDGDTSPRPWLPCPEPAMAAFVLNDTRERFLRLREEEGAELTEAEQELTKQATDLLMRKLLFNADKRLIVYPLRQPIGIYFFGTVQGEHLALEQLCIEAAWHMMVFDETPSVDDLVEAVLELVRVAPEDLNKDGCEYTLLAPYVLIGPREYQARGRAATDVADRWFTRFARVGINPPKVEGASSYFPSS